MYPIINIFGIQIYLFGLSITICFFLFAWMLKRTSVRQSFDFTLFTNNILWFFLSVFFFSRLFYVISRWHDLKYIKNLQEFFIMNSYDFSLVGGIFGFFLVLFILLKLKKQNLDKYINGLTVAFLFVLPLAFLGALLGGEVYGTDTRLGIEIVYNNPLTPVPFKSPIFPLPIVYSVLFFILFSGIYILNMYTRQKALLGYIGLALFSTIIFIFEFFSGKYGLLKDNVGVNLSQFSAIALFIFALYRIYKIYTRKVNV